MALGVDGYVCRYRNHFIHWRPLANGDIGIVTILLARILARILQIARFQEDAGAG